MLQDCLPATFKLTCPKGNNKAREPDFAVSGGLKCKLCQQPPTTIADKDPRPGFMRLVVKFGELMKLDGALPPAGVIAGYEVWITDSDGRKSVGPVANLTKPSYAETCCRNNKYRAKIARKFTTGERLAITPYSASGNTLPFVYLSGLLIDKTAGQVKNITGDFTIKLSNADANKLVATDEAIASTKTAFSRALAKTIEGVDEDEIDIIQIFIDGVAKLPKRAARRRLLEALARRLADADVKVVYEILSTNTSLVITKTSINATALKKNIEDETAAVGLAVTVTALPVISTPKSETVGTPVGTTSGAPLTHIFSALAAVFVVGAYFMN